MIKNIGSKLAIGCLLWRFSLFRCKNYSGWVGLVLRSKQPKSSSWSFLIVVLLVFLLSGDLSGFGLLVEAVCSIVSPASFFELVDFLEVFDCGFCV